MTDSRVLMLFSGGQDATACLAGVLGREARVETIGSAKRQRHCVESAAGP